MRRAERLFRLVALMRQQRLSRADDLAAELEVNVRTIYRDIAHLQGSGIPIEGASGIGYILQQGFDLPAMTLTYEQINAVALGLSFIEEAGDESLIQAAREVRAKLDSSLPNKRALTSAPFFAARQGLRAPATAKMIRDAIRDRIILEIEYSDSLLNVTQRQVQPLAMTVFTEGWMFAAWCELREDFRYFRLDRIKSLLWTSKQFEADEEKSLKTMRQLRPHN